MEKDELIKAFETSLEMEEQGRGFYIEAARKVKSEMTRRVFEALADDEIRHISAIKGYWESLVKSGVTPPLSTTMPRHKDIKDRLFFGKNKLKLLKEINPEADEMEAYRVAMDMENSGYRFYKRLAESITDSNVNELYKFLLLEEERHFELLLSTYEYLKDPRAWFAKDERPIVEG